MNSNKPKTVRCAIYTRKSSEEGLEQEFNSLDAQRDACAAYVMSQAGEGWLLLPDQYDDGGFSGGNMQRPGLARLLADIAAGRIDVVVVYKVDRLTRSLRDFAKIVDTLDSAGASFVSVTQAFNTTSSMGRLTLNMLLSFAQFEREVTGERIRDKIEASKKRGLWMGGTVPLGYLPKGRTLEIEDTEARTVRFIFSRYLELESVEALRAELAEGGYRTKSWTSKRGTTRGGVPYGRGPLYHLLSNRLYVGEIPHKGQFHPGQHPPIVERSVFDQVQAKLLATAGDKRRTEGGLAPLVPASPLTGLVFDDAGNRMSPVSARRRGDYCYRYYVSTAAQLGRGEKAGSLARVPADSLEALILQRARILGLYRDGDVAWQTLREAAIKVVVSRRCTRVIYKRKFVDRSAIDIDALQHVAPPGDLVTIGDDEITLEIPTVVQQRGGSKQVTLPDGSSPASPNQIDRVLLKALVRAEGWKQDLRAGRARTLQEIASHEGLQLSHVQRLIRLTFLRPSLKRAILDGRTPAWLTLQRVMQRGVPTLWADQPRALI